MCSKEAQLFIDLCFKDGQIRVIKPVLGESYSFPDEPKLIKFTSSILEEIEQSDKVKVKKVEEKTVMIQGMSA